MVIEWDRDILPEEEEKIIEKIADIIIKNKLELPAEFLLSYITPMAYAGGEVLKMVLFPYLGLIGEPSYKVINTLRKKENIEKILNKIR